MTCVGSGRGEGGGTGTTFYLLSFPPEKDLFTGKGTDSGRGKK